MPKQKNEEKVAKKEKDVFSGHPGGKSEAEKQTGVVGDC